MGVVRARNALGTLRSATRWIRNGPSQRPYIFITGAPRSGTTLLKTVLTAHTKIAGGDYESTGLFKLRNLGEYACGEITNDEIRVLLRRTKGITDFYDLVADKLLDHWGGERFVDKVWPHSIRLRFVASHFPAARWIHIVRDGRDCFCSARRHPNVPQSGRLENFASYWSKCLRLAETHVPKDNIYSLRYEDLTTDPHGGVRKLMAFLNLDAEHAQFAPASSSRIPSIRKSEYHDRLTQPLDNKSVGRYLDELTEAEVEMFSRVAGEMLTRYGYLVA